MPTYVYETIPQQAGEKPRQFEVVQSMRDAPFTKDPQTGLPVRRVISLGYSLITERHPTTPKAGQIKDRPAKK